MNFLFNFLKRKKRKKFLVTRECITTLHYAGDTGCTTTLREVINSNKTEHKKTFIEDFLSQFWKEKIILELHHEAYKLSDGQPYELTFDESFNLFPSNDFSSLLETKEETTTEKTYDRK